MQTSNWTWLGRAAILAVYIGVLVGAWLMANRSAPVEAQGPQIHGPFVTAPIKPSALKGDLRRLPPAPQRQPRIFPLAGRGQGPSPKTTAPAPDPAPLQPSSTFTMPPPIKNLDGIAFTFSGWPPDPNGDVGLNHYIQAVNISFAIYSKTVTLLSGPTDINTLWLGASTGTPCDENNRTDPIVLYDQLADRWLLSNVAYAADLLTGAPLPPFYECIAVSQTSDPVSGGWYRYAMLGDSNLLNDYPKFGLWPDGYYMTANMYDLSTNDLFVRVWALDRNSMLSGGGLTAVYFDLPKCFGADSTCSTISLLPSNMRGTTPPIGSPNYSANIGTANTDAGVPYSSDVIHLWKFHVDWNNTGNSTFTGPTNVSVSSFTEPLIGITTTHKVGMDLVPQKGTTNLLETLGDRLLMQAQYRYRPAAGAQSLWLAHTIITGSVTGIRWYEIGISGSSFVLNQQGTYEPGDGNFRWLPSIAVDRQGNAAVGYSVSGSTMNPAIRYAGRLVTDPSGQMAQGEATLINGTGSQTIFPFLGAITRWGDYSAMTIDPRDDCTFWYTNEYYALDGFLWRTRIGSFKMPSCPALGTPIPSLFLPLIKR